MKPAPDFWARTALLCFGASSIGALLITPFRDFEAPPPAAESISGALFEPSDRRDLSQVEAKVGELGLAGIPILLKEVRTGQANNRHIVVALTLLGPAALPTLLPYLDDRNDAVRLVVTRTIASLGARLEPQADLVVPSIVHRLYDPSGEVRYAAILALMHFQLLGEQPIPGLIAALQETEELSETDVICTQQAAAYVLGKIGANAKGAVPELTRIFNDSTSQARDSAGIALWRITGETNLILPCPEGKP